MNNILEVTELSFSYTKDAPVLDRVSLQLQRGEVMMLMGPNGCGKTTLLKLILRLLPSNAKQILIQGRPQGSYSTMELAREIAYVPQSSSGASCDYSVREFLLMGRTPHINLFQLPSQNDCQIAEKYAEECGVADLLDTPIRHLSGGQFQLVTIARALVQGSELIIMDEPLSALDLRNQARMLKMLLKLQAQGKTVLLSTHDPNHALAIDCTVCGFLGRTIDFCEQASNALSMERISAMYGDSIVVRECNREKWIAFHNLLSS